MTKRADSGSNWRTVYPGISGNGRNQFVPLGSARDLASTTAVLVDTPVDRASAPDMVKLMLDMARVSFPATLVDGNNAMSIDQIGNGSARLRPLSYRYYYEFYKGLDARNTLRAGVHANLRTLREMLAVDGAPGEPNSDMAPCKLGVSCLIVEGKHGGIRRMLTTTRSMDNVYYPGAKDSSFSGGVEIEDVAGGRGNLAEIIKVAASRECQEELGVALPRRSIDIVGLWRDLERCSAQAFGIVFVDDLSAVRVKPSSELTAFRIENARPNWLQRMFGGGAQTPELGFLVDLALRTR